MIKNPVLVLNPKCATTSIRTALNYTPPKTHHIHLELSHPEMLKRLDKTKNPWVGCPVRNPLDRAVSCYHFWKRKRKRSVRENEVLQVFANAYTCDEFWARIDIAALAKVVPHFRTQTSFIEGYEDQVDQFIRFERVVEDFQVFCLNCGMEPPELPHKFKTDHKPANSELSPKTIAKISDFYRVDYERFAYQRP